LFLCTGFSRSGEFDVDLVFILNDTPTPGHRALLLSHLQQQLLAPGRASAVFLAPNAIKIKGMCTTGSTDTDVDVLLVPNLAEAAVATGLGRQGESSVAELQWKGALELWGSRNDRWVLFMVGK
jgi:hypothetical protein